MPATGGWLAAILAALCLFGTAPGAAADRLTPDGPVLKGAIAANAARPLTVTVKLHGDQPAATYVFARFGNNQPLQRTTEGYWIAWAGTPETLIDNHFAAEGDSLTFKITDEDLSGAYLPVDFFVAYRVGTVLKYGSITVVRP